MKTYDEFDLEEAYDYSIESKDCVACENYSIDLYDDPCYDCEKNNKRYSFIPVDLLDFVKNYTED